MLTIVGVGSEVAPLEVHDSELPAREAEVYPPRARGLATTSRKISVPREVIDDPHFDIITRRARALCSPTDLGAQAVQHALTSAGILLEQIGLVIGDCGTPYECCPSEGQRIAGRLGLRIPSYDIVGGLAALPLFLKLMNSWKESRIPEYVVFVSTNLPSQHTNYTSAGMEPLIFGDGAGAVVVSLSHAKGLGLQSVEMKKGVRHGTAVRVAQRALLNHSALLAPDEVKRFVVQEVQETCKTFSVTPDKLWCVGPELYAPEVASFIEETGISASHFISSSLTNGFSLGSSQIIALSEAMPLMKTDDYILLMHTGDGSWSGSIVLKMVSNT